MTCGSTVSAHDEVIDYYLKLPRSISTLSGPSPTHTPAYRRLDYGAACAQHISERTRTQVTIDGHGPNGIPGSEIISLPLHVTNYGILAYMLFGSETRAAEWPACHSHGRRENYRLSNVASGSVHASLRVCISAEYDEVI